MLFGGIFVSIFGRILFCVYQFSPYGFLFIDDSNLIVNALESGKNLFFVLLAGIFIVVSYFFRSISLSEIAKRLDLGREEFLFIPVINTYLFSVYAKKKLKGWKHSFAILPVIFFLEVFFPTSQVPIFNFFELFGLFWLFDRTVINYNIYKLFSRKSIFISILDFVTLGLFSPFLLFSLRKNSILGNLEKVKSVKYK